jgi:hypothetical protein
LYRHRVASKRHHPRTKRTMNLPQRGLEQLLA